MTNDKYGRMDFFASGKVLGRVHRKGLGRVGPPYGWSEVVWPRALQGDGATGLETPSYGWSLVVPAR